ncbi:MAG: hypothetical protein Q4P07_07850 [Ornithinimicrobium sp.]|uniref:hypothetical protein n=1 Tax=Ornithinimicrobium sp. TaxID=1977084 RepID=UPI0026E0691B|nr:hypothetical protein [Ornithinimicrobium sp.]MDO5740047.1 hypothetical protein [Ornithinimicrobium sp.]
MSGGTATAQARVLAVICVGVLAVSGCEGIGGSDDEAPRTGADGQVLPPYDPDEADALRPTLRQPSETMVLDAASAAARAEETVAALFESAPVVVIAAPDEQLRGASSAVALGVPLLISDSTTADTVAAQVEQLGAEVALAIGPVPDPGIDVVVPQDDAALAKVLGVQAAAVSVSAKEAAIKVANLDPAQPSLLVPEAAAPDDSSTSTGTDASASTAPGPLDSDRDELPATAAAEPSADKVVTVLSTGDPDDVAALGSARAAGAAVIIVPEADPRASDESVEALSATDPGTLIGLGKEFGDAQTLTWQAATAATGVTLPGGGQLVLPDKTYVALYGTPGTPSLGVLGEQDNAATVTRAEEMASTYDDLVDHPVVPTLEIIASVASAAAESDNSYSNKQPVDLLEPLVDLAQEQGLYVVLDLQPGRQDFLTQAKIYEELLLRPNVGLALDAEWRLLPHQVHLQQIGHVEIAEVNEVASWLADLTRENNLPQKALVLHMFRNAMIADVNAVDQSHPELAVLIHVDGQGAQPDKQATWNALHAHAPDVRYWGWKNFYDEDIPGPLTPQETMTLVQPAPDFISYQ